MSDLKSRISAINEEMIELIKDFHRHPELGFEEYYTAAKVAEYLKACGYEVTTGIGGTGVMGLLKGANEGPTFAIRACLDALEIPETTGVDYASENPGKMHACGHDGNITVTLGAAKIIADYRDRLCGNIKIFVQPSEENTGGADKMIEAGCMKNPDVDAIITPHIWHAIPKGKIGMKPGPVMGSSDLFTLKVHGVAGHGAFPHLCVDPLPVAAEIILAVQKILSREVDPMEPACISIGKIEYGAAPNIISETVTMYGTVRTFSREVQDVIEQRLTEIADGITKAARATYTLDYVRVIPPLINDPEFVEFATAAVAKGLGEDILVSDYAATIGCEEFSKYEAFAPGIFMLIGSQDPAKPVIEVHNTKFLFPFECLPIGAEALCNVALKYLGVEIDI